MKLVPPVARRHTAVTDPPTHRSPDVGEFDVKRGLANQSLIRRHGGLRIAESLRTLLEDLLTDRAVAHQLLATREISFRKRHVRLRRFQIGGGLGERVLERPLVNREQEITLLDILPILKMDLIEIARYART